VAPVKVTPAQARRLLADAEARTGTTPAELAAPARAPVRRRRARQPSVCYDCGEAFTTEAGARRHGDATGHCRFQLVLDLA
jgi:hypothetical protein